MTVSSVAFAEVCCIVSSLSKRTNKLPYQTFQCLNLFAVKQTVWGLLHRSQSFYMIRNNFWFIGVYYPACAIHVFLLALSHLACNLKDLKDTLHWRDHMAYGTPAPCLAPAEHTVGVRLLDMALLARGQKHFPAFACWTEATCLSCEQIWHSSLSVLSRLANP